MKTNIEKETNTSNKGSKRKGLLPDIAVIIFLALLGIALTIFLWMPKSGGKNLEIRIDGKTVETHPLSKDYEGNITTNNGSDFNKFTIKDGKVYMNDANCNDKICVKTKAISNVGESIICLPHKVVLVITGDSQNTDSNGNTLDSVSR